MGSSRVERIASLDLVRGAAAFCVAIPHYFVLNSTDWKQLAEVDYKEFQPLAVDAETNQLYALKKKDGRYALYGISSTGRWLRN